MKTAGNYLKSVKLKKYIKVFCAIIIIAIITLSIYFQIVCENYIIKQKQKYSILENRHRKSYIPAIIYLIFERKTSIKASHLIYFEKRITKFISVKLYDGYIICCFYSENEIKKYLNENHSTAPNFLKTEN